MSDIRVKPLGWIVGGIGSAAYAAAFGHHRYYRIGGKEGSWTLSYPKDTAIFIDEGFETQIAARRAAQSHYENHILSGIVPPGTEQTPSSPRVKPLEWKSGYSDGFVQIQNVWPIPFYQVRVLEGIVWLDADNIKTIYPSVDEAKKAAQADYETRILSAFAPSTVDINTSLRTALDHIEHMAAFIGKQNASYSFESLGEDMSDMRAALESPKSPSEREASR